MKRQRALLFAIALASLLSFASMAHGQQRERFLADTGDIPLGEGQVLRITVYGLGGNDTINVRFRRIGYTQGSCEGGVCKHSIASSVTSGPVALAPEEAASIDIHPSFVGGVFVGVRGTVLSDSGNVRLTAAIIDTISGKVVAIQDHPFTDLVKTTRG